MRGFAAHALAAFVLGTAPAAAETIKVAAWNMNNLHHVLGEPLRDRAPVRTAQDIALLQKYRDRVGADIFALQEVNGPKAANLVFPAGEWDVFFSGRYAEDLVSGRAVHPDPEQRSDRIYTGFAVRRGVFDAVTKRDVEAISVLHRDQRPTRWGTEILVEAHGELLRLLSIHLKSGCHGGSLKPPGTEDCVTLAAQREPLEEWIDTAAEGGAPFIIAGDWNRRIEVFGQNDHIWGEIDDGEPAGLDLWRLPFNRDSGCNAGFTEPIDFLVFDDRAWQFVDYNSFQEVVFDDLDWDPTRRTPSDHCPIVVTLNWPADDLDDGDPPPPPPPPGDGTIPSGYYDDAEGLTGEELKNALHDIISRDHVGITYSEAWEALKELHEDPADPENLILFYTGRSQDKDLNASGNNKPDRWNREHTWPRSHGVGDNRGRLAHNDLHHLMPTDKEVNAHRGSLDFDEGGSPEGEAPDTFFDGDSFEPRDEVKGAVARAVFYMATRYEGGSDSERDLELVDASGTNGTAGELGDLCTLLEWHQSAPPDAGERARNHAIFTEHQNNRNPFIDRPDFAAAIWGSACPTD